MKYLTDLVLPTLDSDSKITTPMAGSIYFNTVTKTVRLYTGTAWVDLAFVTEIGDEVFVGNNPPTISTVDLWVDLVGGEEPVPPVTGVKEDEIHIGTETPTVGTVVYWVDIESGTP